MIRVRNLITDIDGIRVGNATDSRVVSGVTVLVADTPVVAAVDVRGGGPGTRETDALSLAGSVDEVHAIVLSGGSAFGLAAASGVQGWLSARGHGFAVGHARVPIVPQAVLFDLLNGGDKSWGEVSPYPALGAAAVAAASAEFEIGSAGAGYGATTAVLRGGLGSASQRLEGGIVVGALVAVNPVGSVTVGDGPHFWAAPFEFGDEFGGLGFPPQLPDGALAPRLKSRHPAANTTIAIVATNARLDKRQAHRLAVIAHTGLARAIYPVHTPLDGDTVFAVSTGAVPLADPVYALAELGTAAANTLSRAVARGVFHAAPAPQGWTGPPAYATRFPATGTRRLSRDGKT